MSHSSASRLRQVVVAALSLSIVACDPVPPPPQAAAGTTGAIPTASAPPIQPRKQEYDLIGESDQCAFKQNEPEDWCPGFDYDFNPANLGSLLPIIDKIAATDWFPAVPPGDHVPKSGTVPSVYGMDVLVEGKRVPLQKMKKGAIVVARFTAAMNTPEDKRYGITGDPSFEPTFYLIVDNYKAEQNDISPDEGQRIATWRVVGVKKSGPSGRTLVYVNETGGKFRYCKWRHSKDLSDIGGAFVRCNEASIMMELGSSAPGLLSKWSKVSSELLKKLGGASATPFDPARTKSLVREVFVANGIPTSGLTDTFVKQLAGVVRTSEEGPAWLRCGAGCCTADNVI